LSGQDSSRNTNLSGYWSGEYWYEDGLGPRTPFAAHISETGGSFDGTTLEPATFGIGQSELSACISGAREGATVGFTKRYDPAPGLHQQPIRYSGTANADLTVIEGDWILYDGGFLRGGFRMRRGSPGAKAARKRKARVPVKVGG
jgi:hypothetical protein